MEGHGKVGRSSMVGINLTFLLSKGSISNVGISGDILWLVPSYLSLTMQ